MRGPPDDAGCRRPVPDRERRRLAGDATRTRLVVDLSRTVEVAAFTLADPYRVVVDLPQVTFQLPGQRPASRGAASSRRSATAW